ncbi:MAG: bifunctional oligoribonuclease/PAP phosphatase NrnA [Planctomycetota bacterium]
MKYESNTTIAEVINAIAHADRVLVTTHQKPDGDAIGSTLALKRGLEQQDIACDIFVMGMVPSELDAVTEGTPYHRVEDGMPGDVYDLVLLVDTGAWAQVGPLADWLRSRHDIIIGIDHHAHGDDIAARRIVRAAAASTTQILFEVLSAFGCDITGERGGIAEALFLGLATDTGWFRHANGDADAFQTCARLLATGVDKPRLYQLIEETSRPERLALMARALTSLQYACDGTIAIMSITRDDFAETGGSSEDLTGMVNEPLRVGRIRASLLVSQVEQGETKISLRSKPAGDDGQFIDVNAVAKHLNGGGHVHAAGARIAADHDEALHVVLQTLEEQITVS